MPRQNRCSVLGQFQQDISLGCTTSQLNKAPVSVYNNDVTDTYFLITTNAH